MLEDALIGTIGQLLAFGLVVGVVFVLKFILKKIFPKSEGVKSFKENHKYNIDDEIEAVTKEGICVKGVITHVGTQSYIVKFEKQVSFSNKEPKSSHSLYESEIDDIVNKVKKADNCL